MFKGGGANSPLLLPFKTLDYIKPLHIDYKWNKALLIVHSVHTSKLNNN